MSRAVRPRSLRASDVIRVYPKKNQPGFGSRVVVVERENFSDNVKVFYRGLTGGSSDRRVSDSSEGVVFLSPKALHPVEGVWEGELIAGSRGRIVFYNNRRWEPPRNEGEPVMPPKSKKGGKSKSSGGAKGGTATRERATEAQLDKLSAQVVKMRDGQSKAWGDICDALDIQPSRARQLYNRGGGEPNTPTKSSAKKGGAKGKGKKGKRNPS